jgi:hypothetical protein
MKTLELGESINTYDPAVALKGEYGTFLVKTPGGEEFVVTSRLDWQWFRASAVHHHQDF